MRNIIFFDFLQGNQIEMPIMFGIVDIIIFFCSIALVAIVARMVFLACGIHRPSDMKIISADFSAGTGDTLRPTTEGR